MAINKDLHIFLVDDDVFCLNLYQQFLQKLGYEHISCFSGGTECLDNLHMQPDVIFLDYYMEDMNGIDVLKEIKAYNPQIQVFFISGQESVEVAADAIKYGAADYIVKSKISPDILQAALGKVNQIQSESRHPAKKSFFQRMFGNAD